MDSNNISRLIIGLLLVTAVLISYFFNLDYFLIITIMILISYDLFYIKIIKTYFLIIICLSSFLLSFFISNQLFENLFTLQLMLIFVIILWTKYRRECFALSLYIFCLILFFFINVDRNFLFILIFISFINDTIAYISGKLIGGPLIIPKISPKKTWSGTLISIIFSTIILFFLNFNIIFSLILSVSLFLGDIFFSHIKRFLDLKDFSVILRGHGGILDRIDSMFFASIIFQIYLSYQI